MNTISICDKDWNIRLHPDFAGWLNEKSNVRNLHVRNELAIGFDTWRRDGEFSIHTGRFAWTHGGHANKKLRQALSELSEASSQEELGEFIDNLMNNHFE